MFVRIFHSYIVPFRTVWDYRDSEPFDWFNKYPSFKPFLVNAGLAEDSSILVLGCGTSRKSLVLLFV